MPFSGAAFSVCVHAFNDMMLITLTRLHILALCDAVHLLVETQLRLHHICRPAPAPGCSHGSGWGCGFYLLTKTTPLIHIVSFVIFIEL